MVPGIPFARELVREDEASFADKLGESTMPATTADPVVMVSKVMASTSVDLSPSI